MSGQAADAGRALSDKEWSAKHGIVCHAPDGADRCEGCAHYYGRAEICVHATALTAAKTGGAA